MASSLATTSDDGLEREGAGDRTLVFRVGERVYGCDIAAVREIVPWRPATRLPGAPGHVQGLVNLRGILVTVLDLGRWMEPERAPARDGSIVIVETGGRQAGLAVDEMLDVQPLVPDALDDLTGGREGVLRGLGRLDDMVVLLIDVDTLVAQVLI